MLTGKRTSSGSEGDVERYAMMDERKRKRMISNRESARRSRMRKELHMKDLNNQISNFKNSNSKIVQEMNAVRQLYAAVEDENRSLRAELAELRNKLESLEMILSYVRGASGCSMDISQGGPLLKPWQVSPQSKPLVASSGMLLF
uniref:Putative ocs element-binding factor 1-like n=1 Tax=Davidia involucrata TaxID=16924 RepID=A0A5B7AXR1_DAVIN